MDNEENEHAFWGTQPVPQNEAESEAFIHVGPMDVPKTVEEISKEPYPLASVLEWYTPNFDKEEDLNAVYELLRDNYVEDNDSMFRFKYSHEFLKWALTPPGYYRDWHVAVRQKKDGALLGFIAGVPFTMKMGTPKDLVEESTARLKEEGKEVQLFSEPRRICEINFLCVHKKLRSKRLAPILIKEVTRRVNLENIWQAVYTAGVVVPTPFSTGQYFHRSLNPEKLVAIRFSGVSSGFKKFQNPMAMMKRHYKLPDAPQTKGTREMTEKDVADVCRILNEYLITFDVTPQFNEEEVQHYLLPRDGVVYSYVVEHNNKVTDFFSFYILSSTVIGNSKYNELNAAYVYYYAAKTTKLENLMTDLLIVAKSKGLDVCNLVNILDNQSFLETAKFLPGDGNLHYYFYNWAYPKTEPSKVGLVML
ncbi:N-myristoyl transferase [Angomonas deanei]|uniref:Glycylpeptide N-tetradecanoyltransferase n=1 Tax=Angomonas deanei TaxID=59799 RepID=S9WTF8_9TRYP|nr:N-myristoyl transferase [Angomonas deanei]EPY39315.1 N-myristoyl transferase [Angomonas deanei]EPY42604.1 N-myristoyl transferase [Angomonas deanei]CAD2216449.1 Myristoyl-CoA:protein N-myristoyltransferase, N-terminal domain/Myristoyl-CoA:protein N-myristoyltransferase, C-terminal domain containing protein, putative [Angomonas deanei]|eukprot:EPY37774.1 N-myristoyl transferase [Angomonas deanei]